MKTLLQLIQGFCGTTGIAKPVNIASSTDAQVIQMMSLLNEGLDELAVKYKWPQLQREAIFTSTAEESQGAMTAIAPGFVSLIPNTMWSLSKRLPTNGSITPADTQTLKIWGRPSALINFRQVGDELHFIPAGEGGLQYRFEYQSEYAVLDGDTKLPKKYFEKDTDQTILPEKLYTFDLRWRWKSEKGLSYAENFRSFEQSCKQAYVDAAAQSPVSMANCTKGAMPGIVVPIGSWNR